MRVQVFVPAAEIKKTGQREEDGKKSEKIGKAVSKIPGGPRKAKKNETIKKSILQGNRLLPLYLRFIPHVRRKPTERGAKIM